MRPRQITCHTCDGVLVLLNFQKDSICESCYRLLISRSIFFSSLYTAKYLQPPAYYGGQYTISSSDKIRLSESAVFNTRLPKLGRAVW